MAYNVNHSDSANYGSLVVEDKTVNMDTSLSLVGRYYPGYSKHVAENFLHLLENFANNSAPSNPVRGQLWFDTDSSSSAPLPKLVMWEGTKWVTTGLVTRSTEAPDDHNILWFDSINHKLKIYDGSSWIEFLTNLTEGTGIRVEQIPGSDNATHSVIVAYINDAAVMAINLDTGPLEGFIPINTPDKHYGDIFSTFPTYGGTDVIIKKGVNIRTDLKYYGTAEKSEALVNGLETLTASDLFVKNKSVSTTGSIQVTNSTSGISAKNDDGTKYLTLTTDNNNSNIKSFNSLLISSYVESSAASTISMSANDISVNKPLIIDGTLTATNATVTNTLTTASLICNTGLLVGDAISATASSILPKLSTTIADLGSQSNQWTNVYAKTVGIQGITEYYGKLNNTVTFNNNAILNAGTTFSMTGDVSGTASVSGTAVAITATLLPVAITLQDSVDVALPTDKLVIARGTELKSVTVNGLYMIGQVITFAGTAVPDKFKECNGAQLEITKYGELFSVIGSQFGSSDNTFNVPTISPVVAGVKYYIYTGKL